MVEDYPPLSRNLLRLARMSSLPQLLPSTIMGIASIAVGAAITRRGRPMAAGFPQTFPSQLPPPATFVKGTTHLTSRRLRLLLLLLLTSPPTIFIAVVVIAMTGASCCCIAMTTSSLAIPTFISRGEEGKEKTLRPTTHRIHPPLPIILPPRVHILLNSNIGQLSLTLCPKTAPTAPSDAWILSGWRITPPLRCRGVPQSRHRLRQDGQEEGPRG